MKLSIMIILISFTPATYAISLEEYLNKVGVGNSALESSKIEEEAAKLRASEGKLIVAPNFFTLGQYGVDKSPSQNPSFEGTQRNNSIFNLGVEQQSLLGINHKFYFGWSRTELRGVETSFVPNEAVSKSSFNYEFSIPLWRNQLGRITKSQVSSIVDQNKSESYLAQFNQKQLKAQAVSVYWRLKAAQELYDLSKEQLKINKTFLNWTKNRVSIRLGEKADLEQAKAALALREFELEQVKSELNEATQVFNQMIEVTTDSPVAVLESFTQIEFLPSYEDVENSLSREDIKSLESLLNAQNALAKIAAESTRPKFDIVGLASSNGLDPVNSKSFDNSLTTRNPTYAIGLHLSLPLDRSAVNDVQKSASLKMLSINSQLKRKKYEVDSELKRLKKNYAQAIKVFNAARIMERAQYSKYQHEIKLRKSGRTNTFQLLSFQQEYLQSKQSLIQAHSSILQMSAQFILFKDDI